jgi:hypothetical protein
VWLGHQVPGPYAKLFMEAPIFENAYSGLIQDTSERVKAAVVSACRRLSFSGVVERL